MIEGQMAVQREEERTSFLTSADVDMLKFG